ncbi:hypothetical protein ACQ4LE_005392 [Meloidogyne hapla]|uniref:Secreted protein n=1 Tax=Meloidogyne hapla TaxID=6305 RepID=A0A1I8AY57_MELHA
MSTKSNIFLIVAICFLINQCMAAKHKDIPPPKCPKVKQTAKTNCESYNKCENDQCKREKCYWVVNCGPITNDPEYNQQCRDNPIKTPSKVIGVDDYVKGMCQKIKG